MTSSVDEEDEIEDERSRQARLAQRERVNAFLDELTQLSKRHKLYILGHGEDSMLVTDLLNPLGDYQVMWESAPGMPEEILWCPGDNESREGQVDL